MKGKLQYLFLTIYLFLVDFKTFAQPTDEDNNGDLEGQDPPPAPINSRIILLLIFALLYAYYNIKKSKESSSKASSH